MSKNKKTLETIVKDAIKFVPFAAINWFLGGISTITVAAGYVIGRLIENRKAKQKTKWEHLRKEIGTGSYAGMAGYYGYKGSEDLYNKISNYFPEESLLGKIVKTALFNPLVFIPFNFLYLTTVYIRDNIKKKKGWEKYRIFKLIKEAYHNKVKKELWPLTKKSFFYFFIPNFISINYVASIHLRVLIGTFNDIIYRVASPVKEKINYAANKVKDRVKDYTSNLTPQYHNNRLMPAYVK